MSINIYCLDATVFNCNFPTIFLFCFIKNTVMIFNYWNHILHMFLKLWCAVKSSQILPIWLMQICVAYQSLGFVTPNCTPPLPPQFYDIVIFLELLLDRREIQKHCAIVFKDFRRGKCDSNQLISTKLPQCVTSIPLHLST